MRATPPIVLWDIDGTLMRTPGIGVRAFVRAVEEVTGVAWIPQRLDFGGRTDPDIAARILESAGFDDPSLVPPVLDALAAAYVHLADDLRAAATVLPGVASTLELLHGTQAVQTVVTGNIRPAADAKIAAAGLGDRLQLDLGAYGSDHGERAAMVALALERLRAAGADARPERTVVVGDTPRDLDAARANGLRCVLVATGTFAVEQLEGLGADLVLPDLSEPTALTDALASW